MRADIMVLAQAMRQSNALDAVPLNLTDVQWQSLADFLQPMALPQGQVLIEQGVKDRTVYFVESGSLTVHYEDAKERVRLALGRGPVRCWVKARFSAICRAVRPCRRVRPAGSGVSHPCAFASFPPDFRRLRWS